MFPLDIGFHGLGDGSAGKVLATKSGHLNLIPGGHVKEEGKDLCLLASAIAEVHMKKMRRRRRS